MSIEEAKRFGFQISDTWVESIINPQTEAKGEIVNEEAATQLKPARIQVNLNNFLQLKLSLLNSDFRRHPPCVSPVLPADLLSSQKSQSLSGPLVLQIISVQNIAVSAKKRYEDHHGHRFLNLTLTDGHSKVHAVEMEPIPGLKPNTPPGSKLLWKGGEAIKGKLQLTSQNTQFLGGEVPHLVESFQANINALKYRELQQGGTKGVKQLSRIQNPPKFELKLSSSLSVEKVATAPQVKAGDTKTDVKQAEVKSQPLPTPPVDRVQNQQNRRQEGKKKNNNEPSAKVPTPSIPEPVASQTKEEVKNDPSKQRTRVNKSKNNKEVEQHPEQPKQSAVNKHEEQQITGLNDSKPHPNNPQRQDNNRQNNRRNPQAHKSDPHPQPPTTPTTTVVPPQPPSFPSKTESENLENKPTETRKGRKGGNKSNNKDQKLAGDGNPTISTSQNPNQVVTNPSSETPKPESNQVKPSDENRQNKAKSDNRRNQKRRDASPAPQLIVPQTETSQALPQPVNAPDSRNDYKQLKQENPGKSQRNFNKNQRKDSPEAIAPPPSTVLPSERIEENYALGTNNQSQGNSNNKRRDHRGPKPQRGESHPNSSSTVPHDPHSAPLPKAMPPPAPSAGVVASVKAEIPSEGRSNRNGHQEQRNRRTKNDGNIVEEMKGLTASLATVALTAREEAPVRLNTSLAKNMINASLGRGEKKERTPSSNETNKPMSTAHEIVASAVAPEREVSHQSSKKHSVIITHVDRDEDYDFVDVNDGGVNEGGRGGGSGGGRGRGGRGGRGRGRFYSRGHGRGREANH